MKGPASANIFFPYLKKNQRTGWRGMLDRSLKRMTPGWRSAPLRCLSQSVFLFLFLHFFFCVCWPYAEHFSESTFSDKEYFPVDAFLLVDPLVGLSTALAGKVLNVTLWWSVGIILLCLIVPRGFCGYVCPLGTLIDVFDWLVGRRTSRLRLSRRGWWNHLKYYLLTGVLVSSLFGLLLSGFVGAIPVLTRGMLFTGGRLQLGLVKGWNHLAPAGGALYVSIALFSLVFLSSLLGRRFWCQNVCPSGALFSLLNCLGLSERKVEDSCNRCNRCRELCPFDAIHDDYTTRTSDCTFCQTCGGGCPPRAIKFVSRWNAENLKKDAKPTVPSPPLSRRGFLTATLSGVAAAVPAKFGAYGGKRSDKKPLRPPGSVPEDLFLDLCIRCGECFKVCPGPVIHPAGMEYGLESLWTPVVIPSKAGCHQDCNFCTQVCPTGAIQPLRIEVKRKTHMGIAEVNPEICLPFGRGGGREECSLCYEECRRAGYDAIALRTVRIELNPPPPEGVFSEQEIEDMSRIQVPLVDPAACVGCGICEYRCHTRYVTQEGRFQASAILIKAQSEG